MTLDAFCKGAVLLSDVKDAYKNRQSDRKKYLDALSAI
jgi:hypothetical protein